MEMLWDALAIRQHGVVSRRQLLALGVSARQVERRVESGALSAAHRGVYRVAGAPPSFDQMLAIEAQGMVWHAGRAELQRDCDKHNPLVHLGWRLFTFTRRMPTFARTRWWRPSSGLGGATAIPLAPL